MRDNRQVGLKAAQEARIIAKYLLREQGLVFTRMDLVRTEGNRMGLLVLLPGNTNKDACVVSDLDSTIAELEGLGVPVEVRITGAPRAMETV